MRLSPVMKPTQTLLILALAFRCLPLGAADSTAAPVVVLPRAEPGAKLQDIAAQLGLTEEQKAMIAPILQQQAAELRLLKEDAAAKRLERARRLREINQKAAGQIRPLLTPEQQRKYDELRAAAREEFKQKLKERRATDRN